MHISGVRLVTYAQLIEYSILFFYRVLPVQILNMQLERQQKRRHKKREEEFNKMQDDRTIGSDGWNDLKVEVNKIVKELFLFSATSNHSDFDRIDGFKKARAGTPPPMGFISRKIKNILNSLLRNINLDSEKSRDLQLWLLVTMKI